MFYLVDLMPVFWAILSAVTVFAAADGRDAFLFFGTAPSLVGFGYYAGGYPARTQLAAALGTLAIIASVALARRLIRRVRRQTPHSS